MEQMHFLDSKHSRSQLNFEIFTGFAARLLTFNSEENRLSELRVVGVSTRAYELCWILVKNGQKRLDTNIVLWRFCDEEFD
jgi:hypothetical protein